MNPTLSRVLGTRDLALIVIGTVIGSGIFIVPGVVLRQTGGYVGVALLVWFLGGVLSVLGALTYGELGAMQPEAGGIYVYIRDSLGALPAFLYGWTLFFVIGSGTVATLAVAFTAYLGTLIPLTPATAKIVATLLVVAVAVVNVLGTRVSATFQAWTTIAKVGVIVLMSAAFLAGGRGFGAGAGPLWPDHILSTSVLSGVGQAMVGTLWAYEGWHYVTFAAGETRNPMQAFPRGIVLGTMALVGIYLLANLGYVAALGSQGVAATDSVASDGVRALFGSGAAFLITVTILVSIWSAANGVTLTAPRVFYAMAQDGVFFRSLGRVHPRYGTPAFAVVVGSGWAVLLAVTGTFEELLTYVIFAGWAFYALAAVAVFTYRRTRPDAPRPFRVPGYPWTPLVFVTAAAAVVLNTLFTQPERAALGVITVLTGTPAYFVWRRRRRARTEEEERLANRQDAPDSGRREGG